MTNFLFVTQFLNCYLCLFLANVGEEEGNGEIEDAA